MKNLILLLAGAIFLFASCQSDELDSDDALAQENDVILMKALKAYNTHQSTTDWSQTSKSPNANQVTRKWTMHYSTGTVAVVPNPDACGDFDPPLEFQVDGYGRGSLFGNFTFTNRACFDPAAGVFLTDLLGVGTTAAGDQWYFVRVSVTPDPDNPGFTTQRWKITGGSEGGRFERAEGWLEIYGDGSPGSFFVGWGEFKY
jgi:hypothetical protein